MVSDLSRSAVYRHLSLLHVACVVFLGIAAYAGSMSVPLQYDDFHTLRSSAVRILETVGPADLIRKSRWVVDYSFALNRHLHGEQVFGYHLFNLTVHLLAAIFVYMIVRLALEALYRSARLPENDGTGPFLLRFVPVTTAALFVCHPVQTQAVTYIAQRYTLLATLLYLGSLLAYLQARRSLDLDSGGIRVGVWSFVSVISALLAMKSKETAFTMPGMVVLLETVLFSGRLLKNRWFMLLLAGTALVIPLQRLSLQASGGLSDLLGGLQQAAAETSAIPRGDYFLTQLRVLITYLRLLAAPVSQNLDYDYPVYHSVLEPAVLVPLAVHLLLTGLALFLLVRSTRRSCTVNPATAIVMRLSAAGIYWFYVALSVESSIIPISDVINEHRLYLPSIGFLLVIASCAGGFAACTAKYRTAAWCTVAVICVLFTSGTVLRNRVWGDELTMWQDVLAKSPGKARARYNVGFLYFRKFMPDKALPHLVRAIELSHNPDNYWITLNSSVSMLGVFEGRSASGSEYLDARGRIIEKDFRLWKAVSYNNLGLAYEHLGNLSLARANFARATVMNPLLDLAWYNLALTAMRMGDRPAATAAAARLSETNRSLGRAAEAFIGSR